MPPAPAKKTTVATKTAPATKAVATPVVAPVVDTPAPVAPKKKTPAAKAVVETPVVEPKVVASDEDKSDEVKGDEVSSVTLLVEKISTLATLIKEVQNALKIVSKDFEKQSKIIEKVQKKRENARKSPSGFAKPNKISDLLCDFLGVPHGTEKSRTDVTRFINAYVKEHNLNNPTNRRVILPDAKLKSILNIKDGEEVTFFILQRLISHHFPLSQSKINAAAAAVASKA
jgi:chromatin remodeling complex protein RSC6